MNDRRLEDLATALFRALTWSSIDFIRNESGAPMLMDVSPWPWGSTGVRERNGARIDRIFAELVASCPITRSVLRRSWLASTRPACGDTGVPGVTVNGAAYREEKISGEAPKILP